MEYKKDWTGFHFEVKEGGYGLITFDDPETLNALSYPLFADFNALMDQLYQDREVLGLILTGAGRSFISGANLKGMTTLVGERYRDDKKYIHDTFNKLAEYDRPTIAAINGYALGGGAELALNCDIRIASTKAKIGFPEVKLGGMPGYTGPSRAVKLLGPVVAKEMMMTGRNYTAQEAFDFRFVTKVVEPEELMPTAEAMMKEILSRAPIAVKMTKVMVDRAMETSYQSSLELERLIVHLLYTTKDWDEGMKAFAEKRPPRSRTAETSPRGSSAGRERS